MRGTIVARGKNSYRIMVRVPNPATGKRDKPYTETVHGYKEAKQRLSQINYEIDKDNFITPSTLTLGEYLEQWLDYHCRPRLTPRTTEDYEIIIRKYIKPVLGDIPLTQVTPLQLQQLIASKAQTPRLARYCYSTLHKALNDAVRSRLILWNVADAIDAPKVSRKTVKTLSESEVHLFTEMIKESEYYSLFMTEFLTGLRRSEILALNWGDVDLELMQITVTKSVTQKHSGEIIFGETKTKSSRRAVPLTPVACHILREHRAKLNSLRPVSETDLVFCHPDGKPYQPGSITHAFTRLIRKCGLPGVTFHGARHTLASLLLNENVHPKIVQEILGHSSIQVTLDLYSHITPRLQRSAINKLDEVLK